MRKLVRASALLMIVMLALVASRAPGAMAQDLDEGLGDDFAEYEGIQEGVGRILLPDYEALFASPSAEMTMPEGFQGGLFGVLRFDNDDNAKAALEDFRGEADSMSDEEGATVEELEADGIGDDDIARKITMSDEMLGQTTSVLLVTQQDEYVYIAYVTSVGEDQDPTELTVDTVNGMKDADAGDGEGTFNEDGTSEGGLWDKLPDLDSNDAFEGLTVSDTQLYPEPAAEE